MTTTNKFGYEVDIETDCDRDVRQYGESKWDYEWSADCSNYFRAIYKDGSDIASALDIPVGTPCFVVWVEYSTGDSFGHGYRDQHSVIAVFTDKQSAEMLEKEILKNAKDYRTVGSPKAYSFKLTTPDGQELEVHESWNGYFESLDEVHVESTVIQAKKRL